MLPADLLTSVPASTKGLLAAAHATGLDTTIPSCDGWHTRDLLKHTTSVFRFVIGVLETGGPVSRYVPVPDERDEAVFDELEAAAREVVDAIAAVGPDGDAWNWAGAPATGAFWHRRMAHEAAIHCADAQLAAGQRPAIDAALAADGIDELLTVLLPALAASGRSDGLVDVGSLHVHCTDIEGEWLIEPGERAVEVRREHAKGDAALRGPAADLLLRLYNRGRGGEVMGDAGVMERWHAAVRF